MPPKEKFCTQKKRVSLPKKKTSIQPQKYIICQVFHIFSGYLITGIDNILHHTERGLGAVFGLGIRDKVRQSEIEAQRVKVDKSEMEAQRVKVAGKVFEGIGIYSR